MEEEDEGTLVPESETTAPEVETTETETPKENRPIELTCPVKLQPMAPWVEGGTENECRPCILGPVVQWYRDELKEKGLSEEAAALVEVADNPESSPLQVCEKLDRIKDEVGEPIRERLKEFDCAAQTYEPTAAESQQQEEEI
ncbi:hypothetical protein LCGC14_2574660 [marine sediment metagenome]|uniref:Uncharacterized protein n=1 Tax=marine sediment metagenome TaxID=412755 RepID=A0A0F9CSF4_9ZZZZ